MKTLNTIEEKSRQHYYDLCLTHKDWVKGNLRLALDFIHESHSRGELSDMLEIGSGMGDIVPHLPTGVRYTGLDPTAYSIEESRKLYPQKVFTIGYAEQLPFPDASFDFVFSFQTVQSFRDPRRALKEIARVVRPGGSVLLISPNLECPWGVVNSVRHYSRAELLIFKLRRWRDLFLRFFGVATFRIIPETYVEARGIFEKKDDDLKHLVSSWEVIHQLQVYGFRDIGTQRSLRAWMRAIGPLRYYRGGMYALLQKRG